ncbi:MAG: PLP-dependent transferase [Kofleriaceae bacterium]|nr:PLP-dependent transferase [Kofleriaceae bacterium]
MTSTSNDIAPASSTSTADFAAQLSTALPRLLGQPGALPDDWAPMATTYDLPRFDSEAAFAARFAAVLTTIIRDDIRDAASLRDLLASCGLPYDYARLGQPLSTVYELLIQAKTCAAQAYSFASVTKPWLSVIEDPQRTLPVRIFADATLPISAGLRAQLAARNVELHENYPVASNPTIVKRSDVLTVLVRSARYIGDVRNEPADAVCYPIANGGMLLISDATRIAPRGIQLVRKRTVSALLAADALRELEHEAGLASRPEAQASPAACDAALRALFPDVTQALYFCTGLAAEAAVFAAAVQTLGPGPVSLFYAQNGYGGTGQLITDLLATTTPLVPVPLPVIDGNDGQPRSVLVDKIAEHLQTLGGAAACVFIETPTNPELQMHDMAALLAAVRAYQKAWGRTVPILVDTTLAPLYPALAEQIAHDWPFILVKSGSKYFTKGKTTLGVVACGSHPLARRIVTAAQVVGVDTDSLAKPGQLAILRDGLSDLRERMAAIAANTSALVDGMRAALAARGHDVTLFAMTPAQVDAGLACGLLSFYLPPAPTAYPDLVDDFVDSMLAAAPELVKSRVSYGQSTGGGQRDFFYIINPQESTQGALSAAVKNAQKRNNVQICRISVPAIADVAGLLAKMEPFFDRKYGPR